MLCHEAPGMKAERVETHRVDRSDAELPRNLVTQLTHLVDNELMAVEHLLATAVIDLPLWRRPGRPDFPFDELNLQIFLQMANKLAGRGLGNSTGGRAPREALEPHHFTEDFQGVQVHETICGKMVILEFIITLQQGSLSPGPGGVSAASDPLQKSLSRVST